MPLTDLTNHIDAEQIVVVGVQIRICADFRRLGQRSAAMLISPLVGKGAVHQHPSCSSRFKAAPFDGDCTDGGKSAGSDEGGAQFEHSSLPATAKSLFNLVRVRVLLTGNCFSRM